MGKTIPKPTIHIRAVGFSSVILVRSSAPAGRRNPRHNSPATNVTISVDPASITHQSVAISRAAGPAGCIVDNAP